MSREKLLKDNYHPRGYNADEESKRQVEEDDDQLSLNSYRKVWNPLINTLSV